MEGFLSLMALVGINGQGIGTRQVMNRIVLFWQICLIPLKSALNCGSKYCIHTNHENWVTTLNRTITIFYFSSLSVYVHNLENLGDITEDERQALDIFIDQLYEEMYNGENIWPDLSSLLLHYFEICTFCFHMSFCASTVSGQFLNCEGSGLYALQSSCEYIHCF